MTDSMAQRSGAGSADHALTWAAVLVVTAWLGWIQTSFAGLYDLDSYFHVRAAEQLAAHGVEQTFPQATQSTWRDAYSDKDFLFHVLLIPFVAGGDLIAGGKWFVVAMQLLVLAAFAWSLRDLDLRFGALWIVLLAATSPYYVTRLSSVRPHVLGLAFVLVEIALLYRDRWKALFVVAWLHVLAHSSFVLLPILLVVRGAASLTGLPWPLRSAAAIVAGMVLASLLHPYFPSNLSVAWDQLFGVASNVWLRDSSIPREAFGSELGPMTWQAFLAQTPGWAPALAGLVLALAAGRLRGWPMPDSYLVMVTLAMLALASRSRRFVDVFVAAALLLAAAVWTRLAAGRALGELLRARTALALPCVLGLVALAGFATWRASGVREGFQRQAMGDVFAPAVTALDQLAAPEDVVYHASWMDFAVLYAFRPGGRYISGLDPIFLYQHDPALFARNLDLSRGLGHGKTARILADEFDARWVYVTTQPRDQPLRALLERSKGVELAYANETAQLWRVLVEPSRERVKVPAPR